MPFSISIHLTYKLAFPFSALPAPDKQRPTENPVHEHGQPGADDPESHVFCEEISQEDTEDPHGYYRHNGYQAVSYETDATVEVRLPEYGYMTMYRYEWVNPSPEKTINSIEYIANEDAGTDVFVGNISVIE